jgi:hypothetical protein
MAILWRPERSALMKTPTVVLSLLLLLASAADAQRVVDTRVPPVVPAPLTNPVVELPALPPVRGERNGAMVTTGTVFAIAGLFGGAYAGAAMSCGSDGEDYCGIGGGLLGALAGEVLMLPMGMHHASSKSSYGKKLSISAATMLGGMILAPVTAGVSLLAIPPVQMAMIMRAENRALERQQR